jgi:CubicO group peptidase (beta-lactamase class C family)
VTTEQLKQDVAGGVVTGTYDDRFTPVVDEFVRNYTDRAEIGASLCVIHDGRTVVDVWGGVADQATGRPWEEDTVSIVMSCTKGATALCAHVLASRGLLDIEAPVAEYWPEFATNGKERATVRMMLDHSVGVPVLRETPPDLTSWDDMVERLAAEAPFWEPGIRNGYHMINFGWTVGEIVRRVSGRSLGTFFQEEIARPLGLDFWIGLPAEELPRLAPMISYKPTGNERLSEFVQVLLSDRTSIPSLAVANTFAQKMDTPEWYAAEIGGGGGITNARGLAGMYAPLAADDGRLVDHATLERMRRVSTATNNDATLRIATRFALGFMVSMDNRARTETDSVILGEHAFGHVGMGGSLSFADPSLGLAMGYSMNNMGASILLNERGQTLANAVYDVLGEPIA